tara:strand:- start:3598 stop:4215 length:618 start_codon:yes stop_codon:yes gene_type:complete
MTIDGANSGRVGIGSTSPGTKLDVNGTVTATDYDGTTSHIDLDLSGALVNTGSAFVVVGDATQGCEIDRSGSADKLLFDDTTDEGAVYSFRLSDEYESGLAVKIGYTMASGTADEVEWEVFVMAVTDGDGADVDTASFDSVNVSAVTVPGTVGYLDVATVTLTNDDSAAAGDLVFLNISTDANDATNDDATGDREVRFLQLVWTE